MKIAIIYDSNTGNTKTMAYAIRDALKDQTIVFLDRPCDDIPQADLYFIGSWTDKGDASEKTKTLLRSLHHQKIAYFATAGFKGDDYFDRLFDRVKAYIDEDNILLGHFYCQGKMPMATRERYEMMIKAHPDDKNLKTSLANFDDAMSHPDKEDIADIKKWALSMIKTYQTTLS